MKKVTAIITTYKRPPELVERAIKSVLDQTYPIHQVILVDDSPQDYVERKSIEAVACRLGITYIAHETNQGACVARNTGLSHANGEYVAFLDDDDEWKPEKIEKQIALFDNEDIALVYCKHLIVKDSTGEITEPKMSFFRGYVYEQLILNNFIGSTSFPLLKKSAILDVGGFDPLMESAQDFDLWMRLAQKNPVDYVDEPLVIYHFHEGEQITGNPNKKISGLTRINEKHKEYLAKNPEAWWVRHSRIIPNYVRAGQMRNALNMWWRCVKKCPQKIAANFDSLVLLMKVYVISKTRNK